MIHTGQMISSSTSCCSSSSLCCFLEEHDRPHLYYPVTLWASIKKKGLLCLLGLAGMTNASRIVNHSKHSCVYMQACISQLTIQLPYVQYPRSTAMEIWQASVGCQMHFQGASSSSDLENKCAFKQLSVCPFS